MNEIIQITQTQINGAEVNSVNARELHQNLKLKSDFSNWIKRVLEIFVEGDDYIRFNKKVDANNATKKEYILTLDTAKHIAMLQKNKKGKEVRDYFIVAEKQTTALIPKNTMEVLELMFTGLKECDAKVDIQNLRINKVETYIDEDLKTRPISFTQQKALQDIKNQRVYEIGGEDKDLIRKLHSRIWSKFKKQFNLPRYNELEAVKFSAGVDYLRNITIADIV